MGYSDIQTPLKLSVLIVTYNSAHTIQECVESIVPELQSIAGELIIVDNKSSDNTAEVLESLASQFKQVQVNLNRVNTGFAAGNNQALKQSTGEHVFILNPDTVIQPGVIAGLLAELESNDQVAVVAPQMVFPGGRLQKTCRRFPKHRDVIYNILGFTQLFPASSHFNGWKMGDFEHKNRRQVDQPAGAALLVRGELLRKLGGFDSNFPMFFNDVDLCKRIKNVGYEIWFVPQYTITHLAGVSVKQVKVKMMLSSHVSFFRYFEKHFTRMHQQPMNFLVGVLLYLSIIPRLLILFLLKGKSSSSRDTL